MVLNITNKDFFESKVGRRIAKRYFGYNYDPKKKNKPIASNNQKPKDSEEVNEKRLSELTPPSQLQEDLEEKVKVETPNFGKMFNEERSLVEINESIEQTVKKPSTKNSMTLYDIVRHYKNQGLIGEESLVCAITLAAINGSSFGVEGYSGSGKTFITDKLVDLLPEVYRLSQSSNLALFGDASRINQNKFIYIPELQKAMKNHNPAIIEVIKDLTEGKDANRIVTSKKGNGVNEYSIRKGITIIYTLALENQFKKDKESSRRLIRFRTDSSKGHLDGIHREIARKRYSLEHGKKAALELGDKIKEHICECMGMREINIIDPFSSYISSLIPKTQKSVGYVDHYYSLIDGCTKFNLNQRTKFDLDGEMYLLLNLEDHYNIFRMYSKEFLQTLKDLATEEDLKELLKLQEPNWRDCFLEGCRITHESQELEPLRKYYHQELDNWYNQQLVDKRLLVTQDYKTGNGIIIADILDKNTPKDDFVDMFQTEGGSD